MSLAPPRHNKDCPPAFNGCRCACHRTPGIMHVVACCSPTKGPLFTKEWFERKAPLEDGVDVTNAPMTSDKGVVERLRANGTRDKRGREMRGPLITAVIALAIFALGLWLQGRPFSSEPKFPVTGCWVMTRDMLAHELEAWASARHLSNGQVADMRSVARCLRETTYV